jgi:DNA invertase Pin-like site-specific DNA recombinase
VKRAVLYLRVSTVDQTTANQERELREVAARMGCEMSGSTRTTASVVLRAGTKGPNLIGSFGMPRSANSIW